MTDFAAALSLRKDLTIRMAAVLLLDRLARLYPEDGRALEAVTAVPDGDSGTLRYLKQDVLSQGRAPSSAGGRGLRDLPGQPEDCHPLDHQAGQPAPC